MSELSLQHHAWLHLIQVPNFGYGAWSKACTAFSDVVALYQAESARVSACVGAKLAQAITETDSSDLRQRSAAWLQQGQGRQLLCCDEENYPALLHEIPSPPLLLYAQGRLELLQRPLCAVVGSRQATSQGRRDAEQLAYELGQAGFTIISGLAAGVDASAHRGALRSKGSTIAVIGTGIDRVYPAQHRALAHQIAEQGLLLSEFPLGTPPLPAHFPRRNRIIAGLCHGCMVVEANVESGSLITARLAAEYGREVMAVPGSIHNPQAKGCHQLLREGAALVESVEDILTTLGWARPSVVLPRHADATQGEHAGASHPLLDLLVAGPMDLDQLIELSGLTPDEVCATLLSLELEGRVATLPGGRYQRLSEC